MGIFQSVLPLSLSELLLSGFQFSGRSRKTGFSTGSTSRWGAIRVPKTVSWKAVRASLSTLQSLHFWGFSLIIFLIFIFHSLEINCFQISYCPRKSLYWHSIPRCNYSITPQSIISLILVLVLVSKMSSKSESFQQKKILQNLQISLILVSSSTSAKQCCSN